PSMLETGVSYISVLACSPLQTRSRPLLSASPAPAVSPILIAYRSEKSTMVFFSSSEKLARLERIFCSSDLPGTPSCCPQDLAATTSSSSRAIPLNGFVLHANLGRLPISCVGNDLTTLTNRLP